VKLGNPNGARALRGKQSGNTEAVAAIRLKAQEHAENLRSILDDIRSDGTTSVRQITEELNRRGILAPRGGNGTRRPLCGCSIGFKGQRPRRSPVKAGAVALRGTRLSGAAAVNKRQRTPTGHWAAGHSGTTPDGATSLRYSTCSRPPICYDCAGRRLRGNLSYASEQYLDPLAVPDAFSNSIFACMPL
jgi:hypothetical protein